MDNVCSELWGPLRRPDLQLIYSDKEKVDEVPFLFASLSLGTQTFMPLAGHHET